MGKSGMAHWKLYQNFCPTLECHWLCTYMYMLITVSHNMYMYNNNYCYEYLTVFVSVGCLGWLISCTCVLVGKDNEWFLKQTLFCTAVCQGTVWHKSHSGCSRQPLNRPTAGPASIRSKAEIETNQSKQTHTISITTKPYSPLPCAVNVHMFYKVQSKQFRVVLLYNRYCTCALTALVTLYILKHMY